MYKCFTLILLFTCSASFSQGEKKVVRGHKSDSLERLIREIERKNESMKVKINGLDSALKRSLYDLDFLKRENDLYRTTLETNSNIFDGAALYFTIISILLTIIVIALPAVNYFLVLKPNRKVVKRVESLEEEVLKKIESNFELYSEKLRRQRTTKILSLLDDRLKLSEVTSYFMVNDCDNLEEADISKLIAFLEANQDIEKTDAIILNSVLIDSGFLISEKYYKSIFEKDQKKTLEFAIEYMVKSGFEGHLPFIEKIIKADDKGHHLLVKFYEAIEKEYLEDWRNKKVIEKMEIGIRYAKLLFNNDNILKAIEGKEIPKTFGIEHHPINTNRIADHKFLRETKYYKIYLEEEDTLNR